MKRVLLKCSGQALMGHAAHGFDLSAIKQLTERLAQLYKTNIQIGIVIGGGNLFRGFSGSQELSLSRTTADQAGMLATVINGLILSQVMQSYGLPTHLFSSFACPSIADLFRIDLVEAALKEKVVIFAGGTGHPYFTTDTAAALRALEIKADLLIKLTSVQGVFSEDPKRNPNAMFFKEISYDDYLQQGLRVLDLTAVTLCKNNHLPIRVCHMDDTLHGVINGNYGTLIKEA